MWIILRAMLVYILRSCGLNLAVRVASSTHGGRLRQEPTVQLGTTLGLPVNLAWRKAKCCKVDRSAATSDSFWAAIVKPCLSACDKPCQPCFCARPRLIFRTIHVFLARNIQQVEMFLRTECCEEASQGSWITR